MTVSPDAVTNCPRCYGRPKPGEPCPDCGTVSGFHVPHCNVRCIAEMHWLTDNDDDQHAHDTTQRSFCEACDQSPTSRLST